MEALRCLSRQVMVLLEWRRISEKQNSYRRQLEGANSELQAVSITDSLTGVMNRRAFEQKLTEERDPSRRYNTRMSLSLLDVDYFKIL